MSNYSFALVLKKPEHNIPLLSGMNSVSMLLRKKGAEDEMYTFGAKGLFSKKAMMSHIGKISAAGITASALSGNPIVGAGTALSLPTKGMVGKQEIKPEILSKSEIIDIPVEKEKFEDIKADLSNKKEETYHIAFNNCADFAAGIVKKYAGIELPKKIIQTPNALFRDIKLATMNQGR